jgi:nucleotide-binding universal stress UspA family protein
MQRIIVATDGSPGASRAVDAAARMAKLTRCELMILTVSGNVSGAELRRLASAEGDLSESLKSAMNNILSQARKRALGKGVSAWIAVWMGRPGRSHY